VDWSESATNAGFSVGKGANFLEEESLYNSIDSTSFIGKLKLHTPALFLSLSSKELDWLQSFSSDLCVNSEPSLNSSKSVTVTKILLTCTTQGEGLALGSMCEEGFLLMKRGREFGGEDWCRRGS
jgi:hypothetical protein